MSEHVSGIPLADFQDPIRAALQRYVERTYGHVGFDLDAAVDLRRTPKSEKPNSARSASTVRYFGKEAGQLHVLVFAPGDGTGDENTYKLHTLDTDVWPHEAKVVPRDKSLVNTEAHLTLASFRADEPNTDPVMFAGNQKLLGLRGGRVVLLGELGQFTPHFQTAMASEHPVQPEVIYTTGYNDSGERFGDPHAVYNAHPEAVQVCGFIAVTADVPDPQLRMFRDLGARQF
jgi:hypothetical protein